MDPTIEALTIYPAAWAALFQGLAEGIAYGMAIIASVVVVSVVLTACLGGRRQTVCAPTPRTPESLTPEPRASALSELSGLVPLVLAPRRPACARRRRRPCQRVTA
jgi:hypothetical protein